MQWFNILAAIIPTISFIGGLAYIAFKLFWRTDQQEKDILQLRLDFGDFKKHVYDEIETIQEKQIKATNDLTEVLRKLSEHMVRIDMSNQYLSEQVKELKDKL